MNNHNKMSFAVSSFLSNGAPLRARARARMFEPQELFSLSFYELFLGRSMNIFLFLIFSCANIFLVLRPLFMQIVG